MRPTSDPGDGYRYLNEGEQIELGDEQFKDSKWTPVGGLYYPVTGMRYIGQVVFYLEPGDTLCRRRIAADAP